MGMDNDLTARKREKGEYIHLADWRKHYDLHDFIVSNCRTSPLTRFYGDSSDPDNGAQFHLTEDDINIIIDAYNSNELKTGWGNSKDKGIENDIDVFMWAKELIRQGYTIWYSASY